MKNEDYKRLARIEAAADAQRAELMSTLRDAYERACQEHNEEDAAALARISSFILIISRPAISRKPLRNWWKALRRAIRHRPCWELPVPEKPLLWQT